MNTQANKNLRKGLQSALLAALVGMAVLTVFMWRGGNLIALKQLALSGLAIGAATFVVAFAIGGVIRLSKRSGQTRQG